MMLLIIKYKTFFCSDGTKSIIRNSDSKTWYYDSIGIYDAIKNTIL